MGATAARGGSPFHHFLPCALVLLLLQLHMDEKQLSLSTSAKREGGEHARNRHISSQNTQSFRRALINNRFSGYSVLVAIQSLSFIIVTCALSNSPNYKKSS